MKLSEACRLGPLVVPTIHGPIFKRTATGEVCGACRIGSVAIAAGYQPARYVLLPAVYITAQDSRDVYRFITKQWPWVGTVPDIDCSVLMVFGVASYIVYAHEVAKLTADEIADYIETLEAKYDPQPVTMDVTPHVAGDATQLQEVL